MSAARSDSPLPHRPLVGSVVQAIAVLRHLGGADKGEGVTAIARQLGISPSSCFNILRTLLAEELVEFDPLAKTYLLGPGTMELARVAAGRDPVLQAAQPAMAELAQRFEAATGLWRVTARDRLMLAALAESPAATRIHMVVGQRQPATVGATGRAVLAARGVDDAKIRAAFAGGRWQQSPTADDFIAQVAEARARGWAVDIDQIIRGVTTIAAPLRDLSGAVRYCLTASMFTGRDPPERLEAIGEALKSAAHAIARTAYGEGAAR